MVEIARGLLGGETVTGEGQLGREKVVSGGGEMEGRLLDGETVTE